MEATKFWRINILYLKGRNRIFFQFLKFRKFISNPSSAKKILFSKSKPDWATEIKRGFRNSKHSISFEAITSDNSKEYDLLVPLTIQELTDKDIQNLLINSSIPIPSKESILLCDEKNRFSTKCPGRNERSCIEYS